MSPVDPHVFLTAVCNLAHAYRELNAYKHFQPPTPEVQTPTSAYGSRTPGNAAAIHLDVDLTDRLFEMVQDAKHRIHPIHVLPRQGTRLATWLATHYQQCARLDWADDLLEEIHEQIQEIRQFCQPTTTPEEAADVERAQPVARILYQLRRLGHTTITRQHLSTWAVRGHISKHTQGGAPCYRLTEVIAWVERNRTPHP